MSLFTGMLLVSMVLALLPGIPSPARSSPSRSSTPVPPFVPLLLRLTNDRELTGRANTCLQRHRHRHRHRHSSRFGDDDCHRLLT
jgi:hypothetical protein